MCGKEVHISSWAAAVLLILASGESAPTGTWVTLPVGGRDADAFVPNCATADSPLIVTLHAWATSKEMQKKVDRLTSYVGPECSVIVYPQGKKRGYLFGLVGFSWNAGGCCPSGNSAHANDIDYLKDLITYSTQRFSLNGHSIFTIGVSNGGMMANRLACSDPRIKAFVAVEGHIVNGTGNQLTETYSCSRKIPMLHFHGLADSIVPFTGCNKTDGPAACKSLIDMGNGRFAPFGPVPDYIDAWRARNGVSQAKGAVTFTNNTASCTSWGDTASNVTLCKLQDMGHAWPGMCMAMQEMAPLKWYLNCTTDIDASQHAMDFFRQQMASDRIIV